MGCVTIAYVCIFISGYGIASHVRESRLLSNKPRHEALGMMQGTGSSDVIKLEKVSSYLCLLEVENIPDAFQGYCLSVPVNLIWLTSQEEVISEMDSIYAYVCIVCKSKT